MPRNPLHPRNDRDQPADERIPPHSREHEVCTLGAMLLDRGVIPFVLDVLTADDFASGDHVAIFRVIRDLYSADKPVDLVSVPEELRKRGKLDEIGGVKYLAELADSVPSAANAEHYAKVVADRSKLRKVITACDSILKRAFAAQDDAQEIIEDAQASIFEVTSQKPVEAEYIGEAMMRVALQTGRLCREGGKPGISLGFSGLDTITGGGFPGEFWVVGARPGKGKSALTANMALSMAMRGLTCLYVSLEMEADQIARRVLAAQVNVEQFRIRSAAVSGADVDNMIAASKKAQEAELPWILYPARRLTIEKLKLLARRYKAVEGMDVLFVDYLQLLRTENGRLTKREQIMECSNSLKEMSRDLECLVIAPVQISREVEKENRRARMSDIKECGDIEQDADVVLLLNETPPTVEVDQAKARNGPSGKTAILDWNPALCQFSDRSEGNVRPEDQQPNLWGGRRMGAAEKEKPF